MGMFRSKGGSEETKSITSGEPYDPDRTAVSQVVTSTSFGVTWQIDPSAPRPEPAETAAEEPEAEGPQEDDLGESLSAWLRERTQH
ncbi:hypothetical protein [Mumia zhuanghuii]|uniref:Uncharacterized protein n=1 Tax=Mumia zhuanghuii TaxID=2585211 RepID=A0A5C4MJ21_9ACTN|nr:hypothetical protein [Mumia zhuanghuii]TNC41788.1 hypothetical protein FHE65_22085 [Mumia zhuanghuii]TNC43137.1 hypothetical protein FHE65_19085 [Mumia zhuanghuii]